MVRGREGYLKANGEGSGLGLGLGLGLVLDAQRSGDYLGDNLIPTRDGGITCRPARLPVEV